MTSSWGNKINAMTTDSPARCVVQSSGTIVFSAASWLAPIQWETSLQSNTVWHVVKSTSSTSSSTSPYLQYSGGVSLYAWCRYSWVFMLLKCGAGVTTRQVWSESSHGVTRPMISKNWTDFILKWTGLYTLELTTHWPQSWLCGNTLVVMTHTKFPLSPFDQEYNLIKPDPVCITHQ